METSAWCFCLAVGP